LQVVPSLLDVSPGLESLRFQMLGLLSAEGTESTKLSLRVLPFIQPEQNGKYLTCRLRPNARVQ
jgi:hypothetical protein